MASPLVKHRDERRLYAVDFTNELASGETLSSVDSVTIRNAGGTDTTDEFRDGEAAASISGSEARFWMQAATSGEQAEGTYSVEVQVTTSTGARKTALDSNNALPKLVVVDP